MVRTTAGRRGDGGYPENGRFRPSKKMRLVIDNTSKKCRSERDHHSWRSLDGWGRLDAMVTSSTHDLSEFSGSLEGSSMPPKPGVSVGCRRGEGSVCCTLGAGSSHDHTDSAPVGFSLCDAGSELGAGPHFLAALSPRLEVHDFIFYPSLS